MSGMITAVVGSAVIGAVASRSASKKAAKAQEKGQESAETFQREAAIQARKDAIPLFNAAQQNTQQGFQGALDVFGQTIPQQFQAFQGGNVGAQNALLAGLGQQQAAILGQQLNPNALQAQTLQLPDASTFQQQLPEFTSINQALGIAEPVVGPVQVPDQGIGGRGFGGFGRSRGGGGRARSFNNFTRSMF